MSSIVKEPAVILRTFEYSESSVIAVSVTRGHGKIRLLAKGARRARSSFAGLLRTGSVIEAIYYDRGSGLRLLKEASPFTGLDPGLSDLERMCILQAGLEVVDRSMPDEGSDEGVFDALEGFISGLAGCLDPWALLFGLETMILSGAGLLPELQACPRCKKGLANEGARINPSSGEVLCGKCGGGRMQMLEGSAVEALRVMLAGGPRGCGDLELTPADRKSIGRLLHGLLTNHVDGYRLPNALKMIKGAD